MKYTQKDAIILRFQVVKKINHIHYGLSFSQHIPIKVKMDDKELNQKDLFDSKTQYGGGLIKFFLLAKI